MNNVTLFILRNNILAEILKELNLFKNNKIFFYNSFDVFLDQSNIDKKNDNLLIMDYDIDILSNTKFKNINLPIIFINQSKKNIKKNYNTNNFICENITTPFKIEELFSKVKVCLSKNKFLQNSLLDIAGYTLDTNSREISKNNIILKLTEKEVDFLIFLNDANDPTSIENLLNKVWNYSQKTETHTVETHVHRLRKKFLDTFGDQNIIKNDNNGYFLNKNK